MSFDDVDLSDCGSDSSDSSSDFGSGSGISRPSGHRSNDSRAHEDFHESPSGIRPSNDSSSTVGSKLSKRSFFTYFTLAFLGVILGGYVAEKLSSGQMDLSLKEVKQALNSISLGG